MRSAYSVKAAASRDGMCLVLYVMTGAWPACIAMWRRICTMLSTAAALDAVARQQCFAKLLSMSHMIRPCRHTAALAGYASVDMLIWPERLFGVK